jgi:hypothetical protein
LLINCRRSAQAPKGQGASGPTYDALARVMRSASLARSGRIFGRIFWLTGGLLLQVGMTTAIALK